MIFFRKQFLVFCMISMLAGSCAPQNTPIQNSPSPQTEVATQPSITQPVVTETPHIPEPTQLAPAINPLTGLAVQDPSLPDLPAVLVSISHFPPSARPQAGLSFAPYVFEIYITEGATRFLTTFYGEFPAPEINVVGNCNVRAEPFIQTGLLLGNRVWWDANQNNLQDAWERGIGGVCVNLYDSNNNLLQQTTTDSNGYCAFNVSPGKYNVEVVKPDGMEFDQKNVGDETQDSDVDQVTGRSDALEASATLLDVDAGLTLLNEPVPTSELAQPLVGPVRSGRLVYADIAGFFHNSCLIFAYASAEVLVELPKCAFVDHILQGGGYMLEIDEMKQLANDRLDASTKDDYLSNTFSAKPPDGGVPASRLDAYFAWLNQSAWVYDAASQTWWRYVDNAALDTVGILHPEIDRLTNRQLQFENVIVLFAKHDVISPTNLRIHLEQDWVGDALLFRDGRMYKLRWSTRATAAELASGIRKPIQFYYPDEKTLFPLKPGHTWISVVTLSSTVTEQKPGEWLMQFSQPPGAK
jgi:SdrD B-like domain/Protein of unknown function (DUF3048) C-terminal domain